MYKYLKKKQQVIDILQIEVRIMCIFAKEVTNGTHTRDRSSKG